jgi:hypothetical protein
MSTGERPLADVLLRTPRDFVPAHPERAPWAQPTLDWTRVVWAITDNRAVVNLRVADRVRLQGLERPTYTRDDLEPYDWMPRGWGASV